MNQFDKGGLIYDVIRNYNKELGYYDRISKVIEHSELNSYADLSSEFSNCNFAQKHSELEALKNSTNAINFYS